VPGLVLPNFFGVITANMGREFLVPLQLEVAQHFSQGYAGGRSRRFEPPATFGATKTPKTLPINLYHLPAHGRRQPQAAYKGSWTDMTERVAIDIAPNKDMPRKLSYEPNRRSHSSTCFMRKNWSIFRFTSSPHSSPGLNPSRQGGYVGRSFSRAN
jgi:hypothetical protein